MRAEIKDHISWNYGPSAWKEVLAIEARMRKQRKDELYRKQEQIDNLINFAIGAVIFVLSGGILFVAFYFLGKWQGRWWCGFWYGCSLQRKSLITSRLEPTAAKKRAKRKWLKREWWSQILIVRCIVLKLVESKNKWVLYNKNGKVVVITKDRGIALRIARRVNERISKGR